MPTKWFHVLSTKKWENVTSRGFHRVRQICFVTLAVRITVWTWHWPPTLWGRPRPVTAPPASRSLHLKKEKKSFTLTWHWAKPWVFYRATIRRTPSTRRCRPCWRTDPRQSFPKRRRSHGRCQRKGGSFCPWQRSVCLHRTVLAWLRQRRHRFWNAPESVPWRWPRMRRRRRSKVPPRLSLLHNQLQKSNEIDECKSVTLSKLASALQETTWHGCICVLAGKKGYVLVAVTCLFHATDGKDVPCLPRMMWP